MASAGLRYFTVSQNQVRLITAGGQYLSGRSYKRPTNTWIASRLEKGLLKDQLQRNINQLLVDIKISQAEPTSDHHIFPGNQITTMLQNAVKTVAGLTHLNDYMNTRKGIQNMLISQLNVGEEQNAIDDVFSLVFWFEFNLVLGPNKRSDDPGEKFEGEIYNQQQSPVTKAIYDGLNKDYSQGKYADALAKFLSLRAINNVQWLLGSKAYAVKGSMPNVPGTAGYAYDLYEAPKPKPK